MSSLFGRLKSNGPTSPTAGSPAKKAVPAVPLSPLEQLLADAGPLRQDGTDKFFGMHNPSNTCYFNSVVQCLYFSEPFRENVINFPLRLPLDKAKALGASSANPLADAALPVDTNAPLTSATANTKALGNLWGSSKDKDKDKTATSPAIPGVPDKPEDKTSFEYMKKQAFVAGPHITLNHSSAAVYNMPESLFTCLKDMFEAVIAHHARTGIVTPAKGLEVLKRNYDIFRAPIHQDAHEFLNLLLNEVVESVEAASKAVNKANGNRVSAVAKASWVHELFEGTLTSETRCLTCENISQRDEVFLDLSVDLEENSSVTSCLRKFSEEEMLCERNKFHCDKCGGLQEAEKRMKVKRLPRILALHLKRFKYIEELDRMQKLFHRVIYPFYLRLPNTTDDAQDPDKLYELYAVLVHLGSTPFHGHYVSVVKTQRDGWVLLDDELVMPVDKNYVKSFFSGDTRNPACAYVLFYQEITPEAFRAAQEAEDFADDLLGPDVLVPNSALLGSSIAAPSSSPRFAPVSPTTPLRPLDDQDPFTSLDHAVTAPQAYSQPLATAQPAPAPTSNYILGPSDYNRHNDADPSTADAPDKLPASDASAPNKPFKLSGGSFKLRHPSLNLRQRPKFWSKDRTEGAAAAASDGTAVEDAPADPVSRTQQIIGPAADAGKSKNRFSLGRKKSANLL